jgi:hypothetical protein
MFLWILVTVVALCALYALLSYTGQKEGFAMDEDTITPEQFSFSVLQSVMGPIRRLSSQLIDVNMWKDRYVQRNMRPDELARAYLRQIK